MATWCQCEQYHVNGCWLITLVELIHSAMLLYSTPSSEAWVVSRVDVVFGFGHEDLDFVLGLKAQIMALQVLALEKITMISGLGKDNNL